MEKVQYQKRQQFIQVAAVIAAHQDAVKSLLALEKDSKLFADKIEQINQLAQEQLTGSRSETVAKRVARVTMVDGVMSLVNRMIAYGEATGDLVLLSEVRMTRSDFLYRRAATALFKARRILAKAREMQSALEKDYKLTTAVINGVSNHIENFAILIEAPGKAIDSRAIITNTLEEVFAEAGRILNKRLVGHVSILREDHPRFAEAFAQASILEGRRSGDTPPAPDDPAAPATTAAPVGLPAVEAVPYVTSAPSANGNGRHPAPEPVTLDLAR